MNVTVSALTMRMKLVPFRLLVSRSFCNKRNCIPVWRITTKITPRTISAAPTQPFSITSGRFRNGSEEKHAHKQRKAPNVPTEAAEGDPFDFSHLQSKIQQALAQLKDDLSKLKSGGRFNPDLLEGLRVHLVKASKEALKLGDLAQVVPRGGRTIAVLVGETEVYSLALYIHLLHDFMELSTDATRSTSAPSPPPSSPALTPSTRSRTRTTPLNSPSPFPRRRRSPGRKRSIR